MKRIAALATAALAFALASAGAAAQTPPVSGAAPAASSTPPAMTPGIATAPATVFVVSAVVNTIPLTPVNRRATRVCNVTGVVRQYCGANGICEINSRVNGATQAFFTQRQNEIAQSCDTRLSTITDVKVAYRCRYGDRVDGNIIEETRSIALEDTGEPLGRSGFRIIMACH